MKWRNFDEGEGYYHITEWLPLLARNDLRRAVVHEIKLALKRYGATLAAYVIMPDRVHLLVYLPSRDVLHKFLKCWRGRSARMMIDILLRQQDADALAVLAAHADSRRQYAAWKEQVRSLPVLTWKKLLAKIEYIHAKPVQRGLVPHPADWPHSSWSFYESETAGLLPIVPPEP